MTQANETNNTAPAAEEKADFTKTDFVVKEGNIHVHPSAETNFNAEAFKKGRVIFKGESVPKNIKPDVLKGWFDRGLIITKKAWDKIQEEIKAAEAKAAAAKKRG